MVVAGQCSEGDHDGYATVRRRLHDEPGADESTLLEVAPDALDGLRQRIEFLATDLPNASLATLGTMSTRTRPASTSSLAVRQWARTISGATSRVSCSKSCAVTAFPRARSSIGPRALTSSIGLGRGATDRRPAVLHPRDVGHAGLEHPDLSPPYIALGSAAGPVGRHPQRRRFWWDRAVLRHGAVALADCRPEGQPHRRPGRCESTDLTCLRAPK